MGVDEAVASLQASQIKNYSITVQVFRECDRDRDRDRSNHFFDF